MKRAGWIMPWTAMVVAGLFSAGRAQSAASPRRILGADNGRVAIVTEKGDVEWEVPFGGGTHDLQLLPNGNVLMITGPTTVVEVNRDKQVVWKYESKAKEGYNGRIEIHSAQRLPDGLTMIAETGNVRIIEVDRDGRIVHETPLHVDHPSTHSDTRNVRKLANGHYLVAHENDGTVREYEPSGKIVWSYKLDLAGRPESPGHGPEGHGYHVYQALRLANGDTLIGGGNNNRVLEVNRDGKIVWSIDHAELPGITLAWVTQLEVLPNGHIIIGNCHAGPDNPQLIEVTRDKKVVWTFKDFKTFGNGLAATQVLDLPKGVLR